MHHRLLRIPYLGRKSGRGSVLRGGLANASGPAGIAEIVVAHAEIVPAQLLRLAANLILQEFERLDDVAAETIDVDGRPIAHGPFLLDLPIPVVQQLTVGLQRLARQPYVSFAVHSGIVVRARLWPRRGCWASVRRASAPR